MKRAIKKLLLATSIAVGMGGMFTAPALAGSLTNSSIGGSAANDYWVYDSNGTNTIRVDSTLENLQRVLDGDAGDPTGNVELAASSEKRGFDFTKNTTLEGQIGGKDIIFSSLTEDDWYSTDASGMSFAQRWFNEALTANGYGKLVESSNDFVLSFMYKKAFNMFENGGGLERFSDPNISYVNQDDSTGLISIGLAGHFDAYDLLMSNLPPILVGLVDEFRDPSQNGTPIQASEIVKVTYDGVTDYLYSFEATETGLTDKDDGFSHNGNYEVQFQGIKPKNVDFSRTATTPEPSIMLGLLGVAGVFVSKRKVKKA